MWEMIMIGFVARKHTPFLKSVVVNSKATGVGGLFGNKGGL